MPTNMNPSNDYRCVRYRNNCPDEVTVNLSEAIAKVAKLRALAQSSNVNEAANAAAAAERIMQEYRISESEVEARGDAPNMPDPTTDEKIPIWNQRVTHWQLQLIARLAREYQTKIVQGVRSFDGTDYRLGVHLFGRKSDIEIVKYQYSFLSAEIVRLCLLHGKGKGKSWATSYCMGAVDGFCFAMRAASQETKQQATSAALVKLDERASLANAAAHAYYNNLGKAKNYGTTRDHSAYSQGMRDGANISNRTALPGSTRGLLK